MKKSLWPSLQSAWHLGDPSETPWDQSTDLHGFFCQMLLQMACRLKDQEASCTWVWVYFARMLESQWRLPRLCSPSVSFNSPAVGQEGAWAGYVGCRDMWAVIQSWENRGSRITPPTFVLGIGEEMGSLSFQPAVIGVVVHLTFVILPVLQEQGGRGLGVARNSAVWVPETRWIQLVQSTFLETPFGK